MMQSKPYARVAGPRVAAVQANVALAADLQRAYDEAIRLFGKIDIVVNNAGTSRTGAFEEITDEVWREDFDEKLFAAIRLTRLVWAQMKERRWGVPVRLGIARLEYRPRGWESRPDLGAERRRAGWRRFHERRGHLLAAFRFGRVGNARGRNFPDSRPAGPCRGDQALPGVRLA